jgi:DNA-binding HxlR family transcriptional regulator
MRHSADACPCAPRTGTVFALLGKRWNGQVIDLLLQGPARFGQLVAALPGLSNRVLTERLAELREAGLVARGDGQTYVLTERGEGLRPAMDALATWCVPTSPGAETTGADHCGDDPCGGGVWEAFARAGERVRGALEQGVRDAGGMPPSYLELLVQLRFAGGRMRMSELAAATHSKPSRITHAVRRLEQAGWVVRDGDPSDGRGSAAAITERGTRAVEDAWPAYLRVVHGMLDALTPDEQEQLRMLCEKIAAGFAES